MLASLSQRYLMCALCAALAIAAALAVLTTLGAVA